MLCNYLKMAWKVLGRRKFFTFVSLFGIGFTLTVLLIVVALADHHLAPSYPESRLDRMLVLDRLSIFGERSRWVSGPGYRFLDRYSRDLPGVERMSICSPENESVTFVDGRKLVFKTRFADAAFWQVMDFVFLEGAAFTAEDDEQARRVAVISESSRRRLFGDQPALGRTVELDGHAHRIVGVVRDVPWFRRFSTAEIWLPLQTVTATGFFDALIGPCAGIYLLEPGADRRQVQAAFRERLGRVELPDPERFHTVVGLPMTTLELVATMDLEDGKTAPRRLILLAVLAVLGFMALPAINLVNINLSRIYERAGEIGVRKAFGASGRDLVLQFVVENVVLCLLGGLLSLVAAFALLRIAAFLPQLPIQGVHLNWRVFLVALVLALLFGLISGVWPAWKMSRQHPVDALKGGTS